MRIPGEAIAIVLTVFCITVGCSYLWGYAVGTADHQCYVTQSE